MFVVVLCGGGGKSYLSKKYPDIFLDIDDFVWSDRNKYYHKHINNAIRKKSDIMVGNLYYKILTDNKNYFKETKKIILVHHPINAKWIGMNIEATIRPSIKFLKYNIKNKNKQLKYIAYQNWKNLDYDNTLEYKSYDHFDKIIHNILDKHNIKYK